MVLGFGRKKKTTEEPQLRTSPSLPELSQQGIPWPEELVDVNSVNAARSEPVPHGAAKTSFQSVRGTIPFHRPFRSPAPESPTVGDTSIASLYTSKNGPPSSFRRTSSHSVYSYQRSQRRPRIAPTFNVMVAGGRGTGKTSLLRLLLETCDLSPGATADQRAAVQRFMTGSSRSTRSLQTACIEIADVRFDRVLFTVIDTPGLDFEHGQELSLDRQVSSLVKYLDLQFADTLGEESKVVRQSKGDQHVHLCIYLIDPESVMTAAARRNKSTVPQRSRSTATLSYRPDDLSSITSGESSETSSDEEATPSRGGANDRNRLTMNPAEIRVIKRLAARANVLPVIARADSLTDEKLSSIRKAVKRDLNEAGIGFGVFGPSGGMKHPRKESSVSMRSREGANGDASVRDASMASDEPIVEADEEEERESRPVVKIKKARFTGTLSRSRSRRNLHEEDEDMFVESQKIGAGTAPRLSPRLDISAALPFSLIAPELPKRKHKHSQGSKLNGNANGHVATHSDDVHEHKTPSKRTNGRPVDIDVSLADDSLDAPITSPVTPARPRSMGEAQLTSLPYLAARQPDLKGKFVRRFRWGTVDVLDPAHCDFPALRNAVLNSHMKILKSTTKEVFYEKYRTEKLLARRATKNISDTDRKRLLEDLGI